MLRLLQSSGFFPLLPLRLLRLLPLRLLLLSATPACSLLVSTDGLADHDEGLSQNEQQPTTKSEHVIDRDPNDPQQQPSLPQRAQSDAGIPPWGACASTNQRILLCEDFSSTSLAGWKFQGQIFLSDASMLATTNAIDTGDTASEINRDIPPSAGDRLRASWSMLNETVSTTCNGANTGALYYTDGVKYFIVQVQLRKNNALDFQEYGIPGDQGKADYSLNAPVTPPTPTGEWARVVMEVDRKAPGGPVASVTVNEKLALKDFKLKGGGAGGLGAAPLTKVMFAVGLTYVAGPSGPCRVRFDDVMLETF